jgi:DNA-binding LacI/PurR family transcriptional regulator
MTKKVSSIEVAKEAGVSRTTVSYVLNNAEDVKIKPETRQKVLEAARKLGYFGNSIARSMKTGRVMSIGVVSKWNVTHQRFNEVLSGIKDILTKNRYSITLCSDTPDENGCPEYLNYYFGKRIDGIILLSAGEQLGKDLINTIKERNIPCVLVGYENNDKELNCVNIDYYQGAYIAARLLIDKGRTKIISIIHDTIMPQEEMRLRGIKKAISDASLPEENHRSIIISSSECNNHEIIRNTLEQKKDYTAVIASWRATAFKTLYYANKSGMRIPEELAVISLDGSEFADYSFPALSTSDLPLYEIGVRSAEMMVNTLDASGITEQILLSCRLNLREST